jgi:RNA polymerase sigma factor (sigma-70 family)
LGRTRRQRHAPTAEEIDQIDPKLRQLVDIEVLRVLKASSLARMEQDELWASAWVGFFEAQRQFDPRHGGEFSAYARRRVRGAIFDGLAEISPLGKKSIRAVKRTLKGLEIEYFERSHRSSRDGQTGQSEASILIDTSEEETHSNDSPSFLESYRTLYFQAVNLWTQSLSQAFTLDPAVPHASDDQCKQLNRVLSDAFEQLSDEEKKVLVSVYDLRRVGDNASAYAQRTGLHKSTVSRRHASALRKLRECVKQTEEH